MSGGAGTGHGGAGGTKLLIRFFAGEFEGGEFPLDPGSALLLGRGAGCDIAFHDDLVSRHHAQIRVTDGRVAIRDSGSTNGVFVNGIRVEKAMLKPGDRVLVGANLFRLLRTENAPSVAEASAALRSVAASRVGLPPGRLGGRVEEVPLADLLQLLATGKKNGVLVVRGPRRKAKVHFCDGKVVHAEFGGVDGVPAAHAVHRILAWESGEFDLRPDEPRDCGERIPSVPELLMEGVRQLDELRAVDLPLPKDDEIVLLKRPLGARLRDLSPEELDVVESLLAPREFEVLLAVSPLPAAVTATTTHALLGSGVAAVATPAD